MTLSPEQFKKNAANVEEGKMRAAISRAENGPEVAAKADALAASVPDILRRTFVGPANSKGRQTMYLATEEELQDWRRKNPS